MFSLAWQNRGGGGADFRNLDKHPGPIHPCHRAHRHPRAALVTRLLAGASSRGTLAQIATSHTFHATRLRMIAITCHRGTWRPRSSQRCRATVAPAGAMRSCKAAGCAPASAGAAGRASTPPPGRKRPCTRGTPLTKPDSGNFSPRTMRHGKTPALRAGCQVTRRLQYACCC